MLENQDCGGEDGKMRVGEELNVRVFDGGGLARRDTISSPPGFWLTASTRINGEMQEIMAATYTDTMKPPAPSPTARKTPVNCEDRTEVPVRECGDRISENKLNEDRSAKRECPWSTSRINGDMQEFLTDNLTDSKRCGSNGQRTTILDNEEGQEHRGEQAKVKVKEESSASSYDHGEVHRTVTTSAPSFWVTANTPPVRINGVMPELIGGGVNYAESMKPPVSSPQRTASAGSVRAAPTVIMGEAGGVRTMIWSQPAMEPQQTHLASTSNNPGSWSSSPSSASNSEESAAQLLLNLGQVRPAPPVPLNMERLWAGDLSQLPSTHQALNLTASGWPAPPSWLKNGDMQTKVPPPEDAEDEDQPMICMICEDKATGLHYGIITCEG